MKPGSNSVEDHPQLSHNRHPVDGALVGAGSLWPFWSRFTPKLPLIVANEKLLTNIAFLAVVLAHHIVMGAPVWATIINTHPFQGFFSGNLSADCNDQNRSAKWN
jgi:hypothetical protein